MSSTKQNDHSSPGSSERISGCPVCQACEEAWRFGELSQQPTLAALEADPQVKPRVAGLEAVFAALDGVGELGQPERGPGGADGRLSLRCLVTEGASCAGRGAAGSRVAEPG